MYERKFFKTIQLIISRGDLLVNGKHIRKGSKTVENMSQFCQKIDF